MESGNVWGGRVRKKFEVLKVEQISVYELGTSHWLHIVSFFVDSFLWKRERAIKK